MNKVCFGCGSILQCENELNPGYIPENKIDSANYCKRCFRLTHYGEINTNELEKSTTQILDNVNKTSDYKIYIVDILDINNETINIFNKIKGKKILLISKSDLMGKSLNRKSIKINIENIYNIKSDIKYISSVSKSGINNLINFLSRRNIKKAYLLGPTNSGKSSLINKLIEVFNPKMNKLTVSNKRNTTLEFIRIKLNEDLTIIDSPGFILNDYNLKSKYKSIIKPITFNMKDNETILINDFYIKFNKQTSITIYSYESFNIKKYYKELDFDYIMNVGDNMDLTINGFGLINIKSNTDIEIKSLNKDLIDTRVSMFGAIYE